MFLNEFLINEAKSFNFWNINFEDYLSRNNRNIPPLTQYWIVHNSFLEAFYQIHTLCVTQIELPHSPKQTRHPNPTHQMSHSVKRKMVKTRFFILGLARKARKAGDGKRNNWAHTISSRPCLVPNHTAVLNHIHDQFLWQIDRVVCLLSLFTISIKVGASWNIPPALHRCE